MTSSSPTTLAYASALRKAARALAGLAAGLALMATTPAWGGASGEDAEAALAKARQAQADFARCMAPHDGFTAPSAGERASASAPREPARADARDWDCARARARALKRFQEASDSVGFSDDPVSRRRRDELAALKARRKETESAYSLRAGAASSHPSTAGSSYAGEWTFYHTPLKTTGCCESAGKLVGKESAAGTVDVDSSGRFLFLVGNISIAGEIDPITGAFEARLSDPNCGEGKVTGRCASFSACSGTYSQASTPDVGGVVNSDSGLFRLER